MSYFYNAIKGNKVFFVQNNKIVGEGKIYVGITDQWYSIQITEGGIFTKLKQICSLKNLDIKIINPKFFASSGDFLGFNFTDEIEELVELFENVRVVDQFNLKWGMVPETFKNVEGYESSLEK